MKFVCVVWREYEVLWKYRKDFSFFERVRDSIKDLIFELSYERWVLIIVIFVEYFWKYKVFSDLFFYNVSFIKVRVCLFYLL